MENTEEVRNMAVKKTVTVDSAIYNITDKLQGKGAKEYNCVQGYTISTGANMVHFITARPNGKEDDVAVGHLLGQEMTVSKQRHLGHANDCAYYNSRYFIVEGGGTFSSTKIVELDNSLKHQGTYTYNAMKQSGKLDNITGIAHIKEQYFLLCEGQKLSVCILNATKMTFDEKSRFSLSTNDLGQLSRSGCTRCGQGIYYAGGKLYKIFSYKSGTSIKQNDIAEFSLSGSAPLFKRANLEYIYSCDRNSKVAFEIESLSSPNAGKTMYMLANVKEGTEEADRIYKISL